jgi:integrase
VHGRSQIVSRKRRSFGKLRQLPSRRWQASYAGPDLQRHVAPFTFDGKRYAEKWLENERQLIEREEWAPPAVRAAAKRRQDALTVQAYAEQWLRTRKLRASTLRDYQHLADDVIMPGLGAKSMSKLTRADVRQWWAELDPSRPRTNAKAYSLLRTILGTAVDEEEIAINPAQIRGAGATRRTRAIEPATLEELATIVEAMPPRLRLAILLGSWCALRYGEIAELRRSDIDFAAGVLKVRRGAVWLKGQTLSGPPKTAAGSRNVAYPPNMEQIIRDHLADHARWGKDGLLFPSSSGRPIQPSSFYKPWNKARLAAGRPDLNFHDLRHTGAVMAAQEGATIAELQARLGHTTAAAAMIYQHAASGRDKLLAERLGRRMTGGAS